MDCGCIVTYNLNGDYVHWCNMHDCAEDLYKALQLMVETSVEDHLTSEERAWIGLLLAKARPYGPEAMTKTT